MSLPDPFVKDAKNQRNFDALDRKGRELNNKAEGIQSQLDALETEVGELALTAGFVGATAMTGITTEADVTSATINLSPTVASKVLVTATFAFQIATTAAAANATAEGYLNVGGSNEAKVARMSFQDTDAASNHRMNATVAQTWVVSLTAGTHTLKLRAARTAGATALDLGANSGFSYLMFKD